MTIKLATFNVNSINARLAVLLRWLEHVKPDVVCLQELKTTQEKFPITAINEAGYGAIWAGQKQWNGVAILARDEEPKELHKGLPGDEADTQSRYIEAKTHGMVVASIYLPNGNPAPGPKYDYKLKWFERLRKHAHHLLQLKDPVALVGDFNAIPTEIDVYDASRWLTDALYLPQTREAYARLVSEGWTDSLRHLFPEQRIYTFWNYLYNSYRRNAGIRIDHLLLNERLSKRLINARVDYEVRGWEKTSDHAPVWIELKDK